MHKNFGEWYRQVSIACAHDMLKMRWAGVESWTSTMLEDIDEMLETVRIFRGLPVKSSREAFLQAFREQDAAFAMRDNGHEQQILAGAALVHCVNAPDDSDENAVPMAMLAAIAVDASELRSASVSPTQKEQANEARAGLHALAGGQRRRREFTTALLSDEEKVALKKVIATDVGDHNQLRVSFEKAFKILLNAINRSEGALDAAARGLRRADEETNILWWLAGGSSNDLNKPWSALSDAAPLVAGWELADLTDVVLGPQNAASLLKSALPNTKGNKDGKQALHVYVNAVPLEWAKSCVGKLDARALDLAPFSLALSKRVEGDSTSWPQFFDSASGEPKSGTTMAPDSVARQAYMEAMLFRTLADLEDSDG